MSTSRSPLVAHLIGARPNYMKAWPVVKALNARSITQVVCHTGQHSSDEMKSLVLTDLGLAIDYEPLEAPQRRLGEDAIPGLMRACEAVLEAVRGDYGRNPGLVVVYGDVDSTLAAALTAKRQGIPVAHVESGLRSFDRSMPEEINRVLVDQFSDILYVTSEEGHDNLRKSEAVGKVHYVGNPMIDTLMAFSKRSSIIRHYGVERRKYVLLTLHRPSLVDDEEALFSVIDELDQSIISTWGMDIVFPVHPRTWTFVPARLVDLAVKLPYAFPRSRKKWRLTNPLPYSTFVSLLNDSAAVITDSGGVQEEAAILRIPCFTMRTTTERPVTLRLGNHLLRDQDRAQWIDDIPWRTREWWELVDDREAESPRPPLWDGNAGTRIAAHIAEYLAVNST